MSSSRRSTPVTSRWVNSLTLNFLVCSVAPSYRYVASRVNSRLVVGLSNGAIRRQYILGVRSKWRSGTPFGFDTLVETIAEAYLAAGYQLEEVQNASGPTRDTAGAAVSRPLPMTVPRTSTSTMFPFK